jgi:hypothetical protein
MQNVVPELAVKPQHSVFFGPSLASTTFTIDVFLWNNALSGVDVYALDFTIDWSSIADISLVSATMHSPWAHFFVIANGNTTTPPTDWHLSITAVPPSTGLFDVNASVLTLVFHIDENVCYPNVVTGTFDLNNVIMSGDGTVPVPITNIEIDGGTYQASAPQPDIELSTTDPAYNATTNVITEKCVSHTFDIEVDLSNVTNVYGFDFVLTYPSAYLETDAQHITFKAAFPPPYASLTIDLSVAGQISISLIRPSEKPGVQADIPAVVPIVDIVFHTIDDVYNPPNTLPADFTGAITLTDANIYYKCPGALVYTFAMLDTTHTSIGYAFTPSIYDLNEDCVVDVQDLMVLLPYYGDTFLGGFGSLYEPAVPTGLVDIFDFVAIAKNFGPVDP